MRATRRRSSYHGRSQLAHAFERWSAIVERCLRLGAARPGRRSGAARRPQVVDAARDLGPLAGISRRRPPAARGAWLVLACDLPFLDGRTLAQLLAERRDPAGPRRPFARPRRPAGAALRDLRAAQRVSGPDRLGEAGTPLSAQVPDRVRVRLLEPLDARALDNVNSPTNTGAPCRP
jgi:molybdopterin-guanine dinucleotide biosynthesis protein A